MRDLAATSIWVVGLLLVAAVLGNQFVGPAGGVFAVGLVLFVVGVAADVGEWL